MEDLKGTLLKFRADVRKGKRVAMAQYWMDRIESCRNKRMPPSRADDIMHHSDFA